METTSSQDSAADHRLDYLLPAVTGPTYLCLLLRSAQLVSAVETVVTPGVRLSINLTLPEATMPHRHTEVRTFASRLDPCLGGPVRRPPRRRLCGTIYLMTLMAIGLCGLLRIVMLLAVRSQVYIGVTCIHNLLRAMLKTSNLQVALILDFLIVRKYWR